MKLVDVDKLPIKYEGHVVGVWKNDLDNAPTVEAIPVEWIKEWCNKQNSNSLEERLLKRYGVLSMLEDWEKENEADR